MVYGAPIKQLEERRDNFLTKSDMSPYGALYASDSAYHDVCALAQTHNVREDHPTVVEAQCMYIRALLLEAESSEIINARLKDQSIHHPSEHEELVEVTLNIINAAHKIRKAVPE